MLPSPTETVIENPNQYCAAKCSQNRSIHCVRVTSCQLDNSSKEEPGIEPGNRVVSIGLGLALSLSINLFLESNMGYQSESGSCETNYGFDFNQALVHSHMQTLNPDAGPKKRKRLLGAGISPYNSHSAAAIVAVDKLPWRGKI